MFKSCKITFAESVYPNPGTCYGRLSKLGYPLDLGGTLGLLRRFSCHIFLQNNDIKTSIISKPLLKEFRKIYLGAVFENYKFQSITLDIDMQ